MTDAPQDPAAFEPVSLAATTEPFAAAAPAAADPFALPPVSPDDPCGPDLDLEGDAEFLNFVAATEGTLPPNYYEFKRDAIDFPSAFQTAEKLLKRTLDVRLLTLLAKLSILNRDVKGFARWIGGLAGLLREHWEGAHPRAEGGDYSARLGQLMTLEENSTVLGRTRISSASTLSPAQIAAGEARVRRPGLSNITLSARSLDEIGAADGAFDFIVCHGVYSWVSEPMHEALSRVVAERLAPEGVAAVSFNVLPGWRLFQTPVTA